MTLLSTQTISGSVEPQAIVYPEVPANNARIAFVIWGNNEDVLLLQEEDATGA